MPAGFHQAPRPSCGSSSRPTRQQRYQHGHQDELGNDAEQLLSGWGSPGAACLLVEAPEGTSSFGFIRFEQLIEQVLGREIDLVSYGGPKPGLDDDNRREAVLL